MICGLCNKEITPNDRETRVRHLDGECMKPAEIIVTFTWHDVTVGNVLKRKARLFGDLASRK